MILACLLAEGEEKFLAVRAWEAAAKNFDQGKEDFSAVVHGVCFVRKGSSGQLLPSQHLFDLYIIPADFDNQVTAALVDVIFGTIVNPPEQPIIEMLSNCD
jgi:hypothetical protein